MNEHKKRALHLILLFGLVSLFGDLAYEGARSVNGPYLKILAANAAIVGIVAGIGEFLGYGLRLVSGYFSDKTKSYWLFTFLGYGLLISVPLLSLTGTWQFATIFILLERIGKGIRSPARDTILSQASAQVGTGFGFGLHEAMDQIGAIAGPLIFTFFFMFLGKKIIGLSEYQKAYSFLWIPFLLLMISLIFAYIRLPNPAQLEASVKKETDSDKLSKSFWLYTIFTFITTLGFANFILVAYHLKTKDVFTDAQIPLFYAVAMGIDAVVALSIGKIYDVVKNKGKNEKSGLSVLITIPLFSLFLPILAFSGNFIFAATGVCLWGVIMGIHETIMRSAIADITPIKKRGTGYGIFNTGYGLAMFLGSSLMGILYGYSIPMLISVIVILEIIAIYTFYVMRRSII